MESAILQYYIVDNDIISTCDFVHDNIIKDIVYYEVIRVIDGVPLFIEEHINRFLSPEVSTIISQKLSADKITSRINKLIEVNKITIGNIRFQISVSHVNEFKYATWALPYNYPTKEMYDNGVNISIIKSERSSPNKKIHNTKLRKTAIEVTKQNQTYEALLLNSDGLITEGSKSNIFFTKGDILYTSKPDTVLKGITRKKIIEIARSNNITFIEKDIKLTDLDYFEGAFLTGTSPKVLPIAKIESYTYSTKDKLTQNLLLLYDELINSYINNHKL